ncbi:MAG: hypothetical protein CL398_09755 [Acidiferrobacteraceae bacterium]|nr:hypothetical protein [Acidiferrobacteraceae bacterium]|tara:strand:- start:2468 stop:2908 length:441 start_codon:yes stop_codon:yes gene_type:complete
MLTQQLTIFMKRIFNTLLALRHILIICIVIGASSGVLWSIAVIIASTDSNLSLTELLVSLMAPGLIGLLGHKILAVRIWIAMPTAYLTVPMLFGIAIGGANIFWMSIGGAVAGFFLSLPFILYYLVDGIVHRKSIASIKRSGKTVA